MSRPSYLRAALAALILALFSASAAAQAPAVTDPQIVEFDPSPDHNALGSTGQPKVTRYDLEFYIVDGTQPFQIANLGKPAPQSDGIIRVNFTSLLNPWPPAGTIYEARVAAVGPDGVGRSTESNTFAFSSPCSSSISPTAVSVNGQSSTGNVAVAAVAGCPWSATSAASWITITSGASGSGNGTVGYSIAANATTSQRSGTLSIAGQTFTVTQSAGCSYSITPSATSVAAGTTTGTVAVSTSTGCSWTASSSASWITVTSGANGSGAGSVGYSVAANTTTSQRSGTVTIAGRAFTVTQDAAACTFVLSPVSATLGATAGSATVSVAAGTGCAWNATTSTSWITITGGSSGSANGQVSYSVTANPGTSTRNGSITIGGQAFAVTQTGQACTFAISPVSTSVPAAAASSNVSVDTLTGCSWSAASSASWLSITSGGSGSGDGTVAFNVGANPDLAARSATLTIGGQTFTVNQAGVVCSPTIAPVSASVGSSGTQGTVSVTLPGACSWTASSGASWITISGPASGQGNGSVGYNVSTNTSTSSRSASLTIAGQPFNVSQSGISCSFSVAPTTAPAPNTAGSGSVTVTTATGCAWTASSSVSWMSITSGANGTGTGPVAYSFVANPTTQSRSGVLTVAGQPVTITQAAGCGYGISPASASVAAASGSGNVTVTAGSGCGWSASSPASWITFSTPTSGTGNGSVGYAVAVNPNSSSRSATITVANQPFVVTQAGATCDATLNPAAQSVVAAGATFNTSVDLPGGCQWTAVPSVSWITVLSGASGAGDGTINYRVDANPAGTSRGGTIAIGGRLLNVTQAGASCSATLSSTAEGFEATGGTRVISVTIPTGCVWTSISNVPWVTVISGAGPNTTGNAAVTLMVAPNTSTSPRSGTVTISGRTVTIDQAGTCDITISPTSVSSGSDAATGSVAVTTGASCSWSATSSASWLTVTSGASGVGGGTVLYSTATNTTNGPRTGSLTIGGRVFSVTQAAPACAAQVSTTSVSLTSAVAFRTVQVTTASTCPWTATSSVPWVTITSGSSGTGLGSVSYSVAANTGSASRTGTLTIANEPVTIIQAGVACTVDLTPTSITLGSAGADSSVGVSTMAGCLWSASSNVPWLTVTSGASGNGTGSVQYSVAPNPTTTTRVGTLTVGPRGFTVTQTGGSGCTTSLSSNGVSLGGAANTVQVAVSATGGCPWTASSAVTWITVTAGSSGTGPGTVTLAIAPYTGASVRTGVVTIAGKSFTVNQSGACDYTVSPTALTVGGGASAASVWITTGTGCAWTASSPVSWVTLSATSGSATGLVNLTIAANTTNAPRSATLNIGGSTVVVNQGGAACNYSVTPVSLNVSGGNHTVSMTAPTGCAWTATSNVSWMTITGSPSGNGSGTFVIHLEPNETPWTRFGLVNVAGWRIFVQQRITTPPTAPAGMRVVSGGQ